LTARASLADGTRVAGLVVVFGLLLGFVPGPLVAAIGGLALVTFGRALLVDRVGEFQAGASLALIAGGVGVAGLRWGTLQLGEVRGVQAVLGPTVLVEPSGAATATWLAAGGAVLALAVWLGRMPEGGRVALGLWGFEAVAGSLAIVSVFWGPALGRELATSLGVWALATIAALVPAVLLALVLARRRHIWTWVTLLVATGAIGAGAALIAVNV
jgi:hypothetical protein